MSDQTRIELGDKVRDRMTGFEGIVIARTEWLYNCTRITVQPTALKDATVAEAHTFDEPQVELVQRGAFRARAGVDTPTPESDKTGGPRDEPARRSDPTQQR